MSNNISKNLKKISQNHTFLARTNTVHTSPAPTKTAAPDPATLEAVGSGKINSNPAKSIDGQTASPSPPENPNSDVMSVASFGRSDGN